MQEGASKLYAHRIGISLIKTVQQKVEDGVFMLSVLFYVDYSMPRQACQQCSLFYEKNTAQATVSHHISFAALRICEGVRPVCFLSTLRRCAADVHYLVRELLFGMLL